MKGAISQGIRWDMFPFLRDYIPEGALIKRIYVHTRSREVQIDYAIDG